MELKKLLKELGLGSYEAAVYLKLLELGVAEASTIYREAHVPFGRVYEELNSLASKGLVEIQDTRPKKYMVKKPKVALNNLLKMRRDDMEAQLQKTMDMASLVEDAILKRIPAKPMEKAFWTVAMGNQEISEMLRYNFDEAEKELCVITRGHVEDRKKHFLPFKHEIIGSLVGVVKRGVKLRALVSAGFELPRDIVDVEKMKPLLSKVEIRSIDNANSYFEICDGSTVMIKIDNPANPKELLAAIRIYDVKLARELKAKFEELWASAKPVRLR